ncbi:marvel domain-containing protein [Aspergillus karnatakaensis]|uniref:MARVEL domain-containing protein n=1 Tax=Aspergillus karnatakaensis TaxID=1810916 RepID=UPI003CCE3D33
MQLITALLRGFQIISAAIVLGISISLARGQFTDFSPVPAATGYAAFCGGLGILVALIGVASLFVIYLDGIITWTLDGLSALTMVASGIAYAVLLRDTSCDNGPSALTNDLTSGGCKSLGDTTFCWLSEDKAKSRCVAAKAGNALMFLSFFTCVAVVGYGFYLRRWGGLTGSGEKAATVTYA